MKRLRRVGFKTIAITAGLTFGWYAAGLAFPPGVIAADEVHAPPHDTHDMHDASPSEVHTEAHAEAHAHDQAHGTQATHAAHGDINMHGEDLALAAAGTLVPTDAQGHAAAPSWYRGVVTGVVILFVAAIALGIPALKLKAPAASDPADAHH